MFVCIFIYSITNVLSLMNKLLCNVLQANLHMPIPTYINEYIQVFVWSYGTVLTLFEYLDDDNEETEENANIHVVELLTDIFSLRCCKYPHEWARGW